MSLDTSKGPLALLARFGGVLGGFKIFENFEVPTIGGGGGGSYRGQGIRAWSGAPMMENKKANLTIIFILRKKGIFFFSNLARIFNIKFKNNTLSVPTLFVVESPLNVEVFS